MSATRSVTVLLLLLAGQAWWIGPGMDAANAQESELLDLIPIDSWIDGPARLELTDEQRADVQQVHADCATRLADLEGYGELEILRQALALEIVAARKIRALLSPSQHDAFDSNVRGVNLEDARARGRELAARRQSPFDTWFTRPYPIDLEDDLVDHMTLLELEYLAEFESLNPEDEMSFVTQALQLELKYRDLVRGFLAPEQRSVFDVNARAGSIR